MSGDNFHFDITGAPLELSLEIAFIGSPGRKAVGWKVQEADQPKEERRVWETRPHGIRMVLYWHDTTGGQGMNLFPAPLTAEQTVEQVKVWLSSLDYGKQPDHDGDNGRGWRVYNESWAHVGNDPYAFCAIEPEWMMYGK